MRRSRTTKAEPPTTDDLKGDAKPRVNWEGLVPDPKNYLGFIYVITNKVTGRKYLGRKQYWETRKGKRTKESDWRTYTGSSPEVNRDIRNLGIGSFSFVIVAQCTSKGVLRYVEANVQHKKNILLDTNWYNKRIDDVFVPSPKDFPEIHTIMRTLR